MTEPVVPGPKWSARRKRWTWGGALTGAASIATIASVFGVNHPSPAPQPSPTDTVVSYPANVQANFLNSCEGSATQTQCTCMLGWFENNVTLTQFTLDDQAARQGQDPADLQAAVAACTDG